MAGLALNGVELSVHLDGERASPRLVGYRGRGAGGEYQYSVRTRKGMWRFRMVPVSMQEAEAARGLIQGLGDSWSFDASTTSARGLAPTSSSGTSIVAGGKYGSKLRLAATTGQLTLPIAPTSWTVLVHRYEGAAWVHYIIRSDGTKWKDGSPYVGATAWLVTSGSTRLENTDVAACDYDDLVVLPFLVPSSWVASVYAEHTARAWTPQPKLRATGVYVPNAPRYVMGDVDDAGIVPMVVSGSFAITAQELGFALGEV